VSLQVKSSEREKSRMYLKRTKVAMQALFALENCQRSDHDDFSRSRSEIVQDPFSCR